MRTTKIFQCGNSQAVRLPKEFQFNTKEVEIFKKDNKVIIQEIPRNLGKAYALLSELPDDFFSERRKDTSPQKRDKF